MHRILLLTLVLASYSPALFAFENPQELVECKTLDVWDAGYLLRFDLGAHAGNESGQIPTEIYQLVPLWQRRPEFIGPLLLTKNPEACEFFMADNTAATTVILSFKLSANAQHIEILQLHGMKPQKYTKLECQPALIERLMRECH
jgi:hypothetical protein